VAVFVLLKQGGKVFTAIVPNARTETLLPIIEERVTPDRMVYTDSFKVYNAIDVTECHHMRINYSKLFAVKRNHINGIENFWNQAKRHLRRFNGIKPGNFN
jgi:transposase